MKRIRLTKKKIVSLAIVIALMAIAAASTLAYYTDEVITHNIITTGAVDITLNHKTLENGVLTAGFPLGVSNHFTEQKASITVKDGSLLVIYDRENGIQ